MARLAFAACLLAAFLVPSALASTAGPSAPVHAGSVAQGQTDSSTFSTHGDQPCLAVYMPRVFTVSLAYAPVSDSLTVSAGGVSDTGANGVATVSFVANYCTVFTIQVTGTSVAESAEYVWTVTSVPVVAAIGDVSLA